MRTPIAAAVVACLFASALAGCGSVDRQAILIGTWKGDAEHGVAEIPVVRLEFGVSDDPGSKSGVDALTLHLREDKTCDVGLGESSVAGTWTFEPMTGELALTVAPAAKAESDASPAPSERVWTAYLNRDNQNLRLFLANPEAVKRLRGTGAGEGLSSGIALAKE